MKANQSGSRLVEDIGERLGLQSAEAVVWVALSYLAYQLDFEKETSELIVFVEYAKRLFAEEVVGGIIWRHEEEKEDRDNCNRLPPRWE